MPRERVVEPTKALRVTRQEWNSPRTHADNSGDGFGSFSFESLRALIALIAKRFQASRSEKPELTPARVGESTRDGAFSPNLQ